MSVPSSTLYDAPAPDAGAETGCPLSKSVCVPSSATTRSCPIYEIGLPELLSRHTASGRLRFTTDIREAAEFADLHFIGVGTPIDADGRSYDTGQVFGAIRQLAPHLDRACTIVGSRLWPSAPPTGSRVAAFLRRCAAVGASGW
ncbi:hypothetical protein ACIPIU_11785 [Streptomyces massasporeus]|uniref:hypothetical protein n=1 Tax=Streptomyces massasporeus TaxID=67324 RepID=UPI00381FDF5F